MAKYNPVTPMNNPQRQWPGKTITRPPVWCSVDLRDGNQALPNPMTVEQKLTLFTHLTSIGFKEIETGFPSASETEYHFHRRLIDEERIPEDTAIQLLCPALKECIDISLKSIKGASHVIFHLYNSTSPAHRKYTFGMTREEITALAIEHTLYLKDQIKNYPGTQFTLEYSPESFSQTELDYAVDICRQVQKAWNPTKENPLILNLPSTVEISTPNHYADQIELFVRSLNEGDESWSSGHTIISVHTHNDRGCAVAAAELALLAGAHRVEGTLFGNGERTGNLDLITMAMNMTSRGIETGLDFTHIRQTGEIYTRTTGMEVPLRHPYAGQLVFTAFSGTHQDAIRKGLAARKKLSSDAPWDVPYLPMDPRDLDRDYKEIIRVNSQSGKGGSAYILEQELGETLNREGEKELGRRVNREADRLGRELERTEIVRLYKTMCSA